MKIEVTHLDNAQFAITARHHTILGDQPADNGGEDAGMTPPELLLASLGSCIAYYAVLYLKTRKLSDQGTRVTVTAEKLKHPSRLDNFLVHVTCPVPLTSDQETGMLRSVHQCLIHNTLMSTPQITIQCVATASVLAAD